eukprot:1377349-Alexandrium_andersonii.AAC.1
MSSWARARRSARRGAGARAAGPEGRLGCAVCPHPAPCSGWRVLRWPAPWVAPARERQLGAVLRAPSWVWAEGLLLR